MPVQKLPPSLVGADGRDAATQQAGPMPDPKGPGHPADEAGHCLGQGFSPFNKHQDHLWGGEEVDKHRFLGTTP